MSKPGFEYDVIFSLAGEQKEYASKVAQYLKENNVKVWFYGDRDKEIDLWGRNQVDYLSDVFTKIAKYCVIFISKEYVQKVWPNFERQFIQSRWLKDSEYLLPVRFDDSSIIGIPDTVGYINVSGLTPEEFGELIVKKIKGDKTQNSLNSTQMRIPKITQEFDPMEVRNEWIFSIIDTLKQRCKKLDGLTLTHDEVEGVFLIRIRYKGDLVYSLNIYKKAHSIGDSGISFYGVYGEMNIFGNPTNAYGNFLWSKDKEEIILKLLDMSLFDMVSDEKEYTKKEFIDCLWNKICDLIDDNF